jgi:hypothetical protein
MAMLKKMAGKSAMMKKVSKRKAQDGDTLKTSRPGFGKVLKKNVQDIKDADLFGAKEAKTKVGKVLRKAGNTAAKAMSAPAMAIGLPVISAGEAASNAIKNKKDANKAPKKKMGGPVSKMMMKKASKKK